MKTTYSRPLYQSAFLSLFLQSVFSTTHMQSLGWLIAYLPILNKVYNDEEELKLAAQNHLTFFNTHPWFVSAILGVCANQSVHQHNESNQSDIKTIAMGPFGGIGDALVWYVIFPIATLVSLNFSNPWISVFSLIGIISGLRIGLRLLLMQWTFTKGKPALLELASRLHTLQSYLKPIGLLGLGMLLYDVIGFTHINTINGINLIYALSFLVFVHFVPKLKWSYTQWFFSIILVQWIIQFLIG